MAIVGDAYVRIRPESAAFVAETSEQVRGKLEGIGKFLGLGVALGVGEVLKESIKAAGEAQASQARLQTAIKSTGGSWEHYEGQVEKAEAAGRKLGFTNKDTLDTLAQLTLRTGSVEKATKDLSLVENVAAGLHKDSASVIALIAKAEAGSSTALKRLGINFQTTGDKAKDAAAIVKLLNERFSGQASAAADTFQGRLKVLHAEIDNVEEKIGNFLIPKIEGMGRAIGDTVHFFAEHKTVAEALAITIGTILTPVIVNYAREQAIAFGESVVGSVQKLGRAIGILAPATEAQAAAASSAATATNVEAASTERLVAALEALAGISTEAATAQEGLAVAESEAAAAAAGEGASGGFGAIAAGATLAGGAIVAASAVALVAMTKWTDASDKRGNQATDTFVKNAVKMGNASAQIRDRIAADTRELDAIHKQYENNEVRDFTATGARQAVLAQDRQRLKDDLKKVTEQEKEQKAAIDDVRASLESSTGSASLFGIELSKVTDPKQLKAIQEEYDKLQQKITGTFDKSSNAFSTFTKNTNEGTKQLNIDLQHEVDRAQAYVKNVAVLVQAGVTGPLLEQVKSMGPAGLEAAEQLVKGLKDHGPGGTLHAAELLNQYQGQANALTDIFAQKTDAFAEIGGAWPKALLDAFRRYVIQHAVVTAGSTVNDIISALKVAANAHSPSRLFADEIGKPWAQGILLGFEGHMGGYDANGMVRRFSAAVGVTAGLGGTGTTGGVNVHPGAVVVHVGAGATPATVRAAATQFESAFGRVLVQARMRTGARG